MSKRIAYIIVAENIARRGIIFGEFVVVIGGIGGQPPMEMLEFQYGRAEHKLHSVVYLLGSVVALGIEPRALGHTDIRYQVHVVVPVVGYLSENPVMDQAEIQAYIEGLVLLPAQMRVRRVADLPEPIVIISGIPEIIPVIHDQHRIDRLVHASGISETCTQAQRTDRLRDSALHPRLFVNVPRGTA